MQNRSPNQTPTTTSNPDDKILNCRDCRQDFLFSAKEQAFYATNGYTVPLGCKPCREERKARRNGGTQPTQTEGYAPSPTRQGPNGYAPATPVVEYAGGDRKNRSRGGNRSDDFDSDDGGGYRRRR